MHDFYNAYWWIFLLRGIFALVWGVLAIGGLDATLATLIVFFGAYLFIGELFAIVEGIAICKTSENWRHILILGSARRYIRFPYFLQSVCYGNSVDLSGSIWGHGSWLA